MTTIHQRTIKQRPRWVVGILTMPHVRKTKWGTSHIMKAYVDWFEGRGMYVLPIPFDTHQHEAYMEQINGLFIPGGDTEYVLQNKPFMKSVRRFIELGLRRGSAHLERGFKGEIQPPLPIWGTCFGMEALLAVIGGIRTFSTYPAHGLTPIHITKEGYSSHMLSHMTKKQLYTLEYTRSTAQNHDFGISVEEMEENPHLRRFFSVVATATDDRGHEYVAAIESPFFPIFGVMWHPERQRSGGIFVEAFIREIKKGIPLRSEHTPPRIATLLKSHACIHYPEHKEQLCYFF